jgi:hypothetical protein
MIAILEQTMLTTNQLLREIEQVLSQFPEHAAPNYEAELVIPPGSPALTSAKLDASSAAPRGTDAMTSYPHKVRTLDPRELHRQVRGWSAQSRRILGVLRN